jgi:hypothetical protein
MLLRASGERTGTGHDVAAVTAATGDAGVRAGGWLRALTEAAIGAEWSRLAQLRPRAARAIGAQQVVDALTVAAAFNGITRVADATGIPLDAATRDATRDLLDATGIARFDYAETSARYRSR